MADLFLAEHRLPRMSQSDLSLLQSALSSACARITARGEQVVYVGSTFLPESHRLLSLFRAGSADAVRRAANSSQAPLKAIELAIDLGNSKEE